MSESSKGRAVHGTRRSLSVLLVEDSEPDAILMMHVLDRGGFDTTWERVDTAEAMGDALKKRDWDLILADHSMPNFSAPAALELLKTNDLDIPFIIVSGHIDEETAVEAMRAGAHDYIMKDRLARLVPGTGSGLRALLLSISLIAHGGLFYLFWQEPQLLPGTGGQGIMVEIIIGDDRPVGAALTAGVALKDGDHVEDVRPDKEADEDKKIPETRELKPEETRAEVPNDRPVDQPSEKEPDQRQSIAMVETPEAEIPTVLPREIPPDTQVTIAVTQEQPEEAKPVDPKLKRRDEGQEIASGSGLLSSASIAAYNASLSERLTKHQRDPRPARAKRTQLHGTVSFSMDANGYVTSVNVAKGTGMKVLDEEMIAMVHRASPFPPPPDGVPKKFGVPVTFDLK